MVKHCSSIQTSDSDRHHKYKITVTTVVLHYTAVGCFVSSPEYSLPHGKSLCTLYFVGNEASSSLVLYPCYVHNIVSHSIS